LKAFEDFAGNKRANNQPRREARRVVAAAKHYTQFKKCFLEGTFNRLLKGNKFKFK